jgi:hypothetical protein
MGLFSTTHHRHTETKVVPYEKSVTINRAPTDKSIELLNEFTEKAKDNIIHSAVIEQNHLKAVAVYYRDDVLDNRVIINVKFILNGKDYLIGEVVDGLEWRSEMRELYFGFGSEAIFKLVHKRLAENITLELMKQSPDFIETLKKHR